MRDIVPNIILGCLGGLLGWGLVEACLEGAEQEQRDSVRAAQAYPIPDTQEEVVIYVRR